MNNEKKFNTGKIRIYDTETGEEITFGEASVSYDSSSRSMDVNVTKEYGFKMSETQTAKRLTK